VNYYSIFVKILSKNIGDICEYLWLSCRSVLENQLNSKTGPGCSCSHCLDTNETLISLSFLWAICLLPSKMQTFLCQILENCLCKTEVLNLKI